MAKFFPNSAPFSCVKPAVKRSLSTCILLAMCGLIPAFAHGQISLSLSADMELASDAMLFPDGQNFGRTVNGRSYQSEPLVTHGGYQFSTWYRNDSSTEQSVIISRRDLSDTTNTWYDIDTGYDFINGAGPTPNWDSHNVISMGISGDGRIHLAYDHHVDDLRYLTTRGTDKATMSNADWQAAAADPLNLIFVPNGERTKFNAQDSSSVTGVTYPRFTTKPDGDSVGVYRKGGSGGGDINIVSYNSSDTTVDGVINQRWGASHEVIDGTSGNAGSYTDSVNMSPSTNRNAYLNGIDAGADGNLHMTWTWREQSQGANHDIMYAYSEDGGDIWKNNAGTVVANKNTGLTINLNSPGIEVVDLDRTQSVMNQQGQTVDLDGGVHALMWHRRDDDPQYAYTPGDRFSSSDSAYYHYYRDPDTGDWERRQLPTTESVGSRPKIAHDAAGNLYALYTSSNRLIVAGATKNASYDDWSILWNQADDNRTFISDPLLDQARLLDDGVLSVFLQRNGATSNVPTGSSLRVLEFDVAGPGLLGDFDGDGDVDLADLDEYIGNLGASPTGDLADLDLDGDNDIDADDFQQHYGTLVETSNGGKGTFAGDANLDGNVDVLGDAAALVNNLGTSVNSWSLGDFDGDGFVDVLGDAAALVNNLGSNNGGSGSATASTAAVPEPSSLLALAAAGFLSLGRRRRCPASQS